jgi:putative transposase
MDNLQSRWSQKEITHRKRYRLKRAARRIRQKIRNLIDEVHTKLTKWIVEQYHFILLPEFATSRMVKRGNRRIRSKTARAMLGWAHYRFKFILQDKTREYPWCKVVICDEHYTSKTCGRCGFLHYKLGSNKIFKCPQCRIEIDRDVNAARNILLRYLTLHCNRADVSSALRLTSLYY